ncbi:MAG: hypothetical protein QM645_03395 [Asticcacaulis sp.]
MDSNAVIYELELDPQTRCSGTGTAYVKRSAAHQNRMEMALNPTHSKQL